MPSVSISREKGQEKPSLQWKGSDVPLRSSASSPSSKPPLSIPGPHRQLTVRPRPPLLHSRHPSSRPRTTQSSSCAGQSGRAARVRPTWPDGPRDRRRAAGRRRRPHGWQSRREEATGGPVLEDLHRPRWVMSTKEWQEMLLVLELEEGVATSSTT